MIPILNVAIQEVDTSFNVSTNPTSLSRTTNTNIVLGNNNNIIINIGSVSAVVSGGSGSYDYSWERVSGVGTANSNTNDSIASLNPTSSTSSFTAGHIDYNTISATWRLTVTDQDQPSLTGSFTFLITSTLQYNEFS